MDTGYVSRPPPQRKALALGVIMNYTEGLYEAFAKSSELASIGRLALGLGWTIVLERNEDVTKLSMRHYTQLHVKEYPSFSLMKNDDIRRWIKQCDEDVEGLEQTKWGQYSGWDMDLPPHCREARHGRTK